MSLVWYNNDYGPEGAAVTEANSGAFLVGSGGTGSAVYRAAAAISGAFGVRLQNVANQTMVIQYAFANSATPNQAAVRVPFQTRATTPAVNLVLWSIRHTSGIVCNIVQTSSGNIEFWRTTGNKQSTLMASGSFTLGGKYIADLVINNTTGAYDLIIYAANGTTVVATDSGTVVFNSTNAMVGVRIQVGGTAAVETTDTDQIGMDDGRTTHIGVPTSNIPPVATVTSGTPSTAIQNDTVPLRGTATDPDGAAPSAMWSIPTYPSVLSGPPVITNPTSLTNASFVAVYPGNYTVRLTATDSVGDSNANDKAISVVGVTGSAPSEKVWDGTQWK